MIKHNFKNINKGETWKVQYYTKGMNTDWREKVGW